MKFKYRKTAITNITNWVSLLYTYITGIIVHDFDNTNRNEESSPLI